MALNKKQEKIILAARDRQCEILNIQDYKDKQSLITYKCARGHENTKTVETIQKQNFECVECLSHFHLSVTNTAPYYLSLDAATYVTGYALFNKEGQKITNGVITIPKKTEYYERLRILKESILEIIYKNNVKVVILEDVQYQFNPVLFKKLSMMQGYIRMGIIKEAHRPLVTAMANEWRSYNNIISQKRKPQKADAISRAIAIFKEQYTEDESEAILLGMYGIYKYSQKK